MKKLTVLLLSVFLLFSCKSTEGFPIPGEQQARIKNIYIEYMNIADEYVKLENYSKAVTYYKYALNNSELYWTAYYKLAKVYVFQENWDEAKTMYQNILKRDPENSSVLSSIAYIYAMNSQFAESEKIYLDLIQKNPDVSSFLENYISVLVSDEKVEEANEQFGILKEKFPESSKISNFEKEFEKLLKKDEPESTENANGTPKEVPADSKN